MRKVSGRVEVAQTRTRTSEEVNASQDRAKEAKAS